MKRLLVLIMSSLFALNVSAAELKVGVVNLDQVLQKSPLALQLNTKISNDFQPRQDQLNTAQRNLQDTVDKLTYTAYKLSPQERADLQNKINIQRADLEKMSVALQKDLADAQNKGVQTLLAKLNTVVQQIAKDGHYDMISSSANILFLNNSINITQQVVDQLK